VPGEGTGADLLHEITGIQFNRKIEIHDEVIEGLGGPVLSYRSSSQLPVAARCSVDPGHPELSLCR
jgi:hypothetical protein